jgi:hypothetical protein
MVVLRTLLKLSRVKELRVPMIKNTSRMPSLRVPRLSNRCTSRLNKASLRNNKLRLRRLGCSWKRKKRSELIKSFLLVKDEQELKN